MENREQFTPCTRVHPYSLHALSMHYPFFIYTPSMLQVRRINEGSGEERQDCYRTLSYAQLDDGWVLDGQIALMIITRLVFV